VEDGCAALRYLIRQSKHARPDDLPALVAAAGTLLGAQESVLYLVDYDQVVLVPLLEAVPAHRETVRVDGTLAGRAFVDIAPKVTRTEPSGTVWVPVLDGTDRLGVLEFVFSDSRDVTHEHVVADCLDVAGTVAELVVTRSVYGDYLERARRRLGMSVPAEMQWAMLPPLTVVTPTIAISGVLEPTNEVAGDSFDFAINGEMAHVAVLDAMGHGMEATILASVALGALRNGRRSGLDLVDAVRSADKFVASQFGGDKFVTALAGELDTARGVWRWITAGHPPALLVRSGRVVKSLEEVLDVPLGLDLVAPQVGEEHLEPGDRLLIYTDGVVEARDAVGEFFGVERLVDLVFRHSAEGRPAAETLRRLNQAVLEHQDGLLLDDATTLLVEWRGPRG
jgi:serine phosphatase RsbU (regulator of sigma subunit)